MAPSVKVTPNTQKQDSFFARNQDAVILLLLLGIVFFFKLGSYPLFDLDEPRYAEAAREMLEKRDWITPYFNYDLRFEKPVFFYWLIALAYQWFGLSEFSARFFSAVTGSATVLMVYWFGRYWISRNFGLISAVILATSVLFIGIGRMSITDMTLTCWMTATTLCLFMAAHRNLRWWLAAGLFAGLGVLTKGPVALVVPGAIFTLYTLLIGDFKRCLINRWLPLGLLLCMGVALPWYMLAYQKHGQIFLDQLFWNNVTRYKDTVSGHKQPFYFYLLVLAGGFFPWTVFLPGAIQRLFSLSKAHKTNLQTGNIPYLLSLFSALWVLFIFCFFSVGNTKLLTYILPLFPALALLTGGLFISRFPNPEMAINHNEPNLSPAISTSWRWLTIPAWSLVVLASIGGLVFVTQMGRLMPREAAGVQANSYNLAAVLVLLAGFTLTAWQLNRHNIPRALTNLVLSMSFLVIIAMQGIVPNVSKAAQGVMMGYLQKIGHAPVVLYEIQRPSLTFYGQRRVPRFVEEEAPQLRAELNKNKQTYIITRSNAVPQLRSLLPSNVQVNLIEKDRVYSLLSVSQAP